MYKNCTSVTVEQTCFFQGVHWRVVLVSSLLLPFSKDLLFFFGKSLDTCHECPDALSTVDLGIIITQPPFFVKKASRMRQPCGFTASRRCSLHLYVLIFLEFFKKKYVNFHEFVTNLRRPKKATKTVANAHGYGLYRKQRFVKFYVNFILAWPIMLILHKLLFIAKQRPG